MAESRDRWNCAFSASVGICAAAILLLLLPACGCLEVAHFDKQRFERLQLIVPDSFGIVCSLVGGEVEGDDEAEEEDETEMSVSAKVSPI